MGTRTKIAWCDHTFNPWIGCTKVDSGCTHCYAEADMDKRRGRVSWGPAGTRSKTGAANWKQPLRWNKAAGESGARARVFCASLADVFEDWLHGIVDHKGDQLFHENFGYTACPEVPSQRDNPCTMRDLRADLFRLIDQTQFLDWLLLTKRPRNIDGMWFPTPTGDVHRANVWLGTSVSDQTTAAKIHDLVGCRDLAEFLFVSAEPLLGPIDWDQFPRLDQVIFGGESGPRARPCNVQWILDGMRQLQPRGTSVFVKQLGARAMREGPSSLPLRLADSKGGDWEEWPADLRIREVPGDAYV